MKKNKIEKSFRYNPKVKLTVRDITEIIKTFQNVSKNLKIDVNNYELEDISEISQFEPPFEKIRIIDYDSRGSTFFIMDKDGILLNIADIDSELLLGLKTKIETVIANRENPIEKESILAHETPTEEQYSPQVVQHYHGTVIQKPINITESNFEGNTPIGNDITNSPNSSVIKTSNQTNNPFEYFLKFILKKIGKKNLAIILIIGFIIGILSFISGLKSVFLVSDGSNQFIIFKIFPTFSTDIGVYLFVIGIVLLFFIGAVIDFLRKDNT